MYRLFSWMLAAAAFCLVGGAAAAGEFVTLSNCFAQPVAVQQVAVQQIQTVAYPQAAAIGQLTPVYQQQALAQPYLTLAAPFYASTQVVRQVAYAPVLQPAVAVVERVCQVNRVVVNRVRRAPARTLLGALVGRRGVACF